MPFYALGRNKTHLIFIFELIHAHLCKFMKYIFLTYNSNQQVLAYLKKRSRYKYFVSTLVICIEKWEIRIFNIEFYKNKVSKNNIISVFQSTFNQVFGIF